MRIPQLMAVWTFPNYCRMNDEGVQAQLRAVAQHCCDTPGLCAALAVMCVDRADVSNVSNNHWEMSPFALKSLQFYVRAVLVSQLRFEVH